MAFLKEALEILPQIPSLIRVIIQLVQSIDSMDRAIREANGMEPPEPLPEDYTKLVDEAFKKR